MSSSAQPPPTAEPLAPPVPREAPPAGRKFPCQKCGARLDFDPSSRALTCPYCGYHERIEPASQEVRERDWEEFWRSHSARETRIEGRSSQVSCSTCGAVVLLEDKVAADRCGYCGAALDNQPESATGMIPPEGIVPFIVTGGQANEAFNRWIAGRWFAPNLLRQYANLGQLKGVYVPHWTFDSMTYTYYTGERGDDYTETETYTEQDSNGQTVTKTRQVTKTRWSSVSGEVRHFFDDVLICASRSVPADLVSQLDAWQLKKVEAFRSEFLSGFQAERYAIGLKEGFAEARAVMDARIRQLCERDIGGDHQRLNTVATQHVGVTFKHILLPVWVAAYRYQNQTYRILIDGQKGKVVGKRPYSWLKIALLVLVIVAVILAVVLLFATPARGAVVNRTPRAEAFAVQDSADDAFGRHGVRSLALRARVSDGAVPNIKSPGGDWRTHECRY